MQFPGTPSKDLPEVLATGKSDADFIFLSLSGRDPTGRDADYIAWHSLDHRPEQYRLAGIRNTMRLVSTPEARAARAANAAPYDAVDHIMTYQFADTSAMPAFNELGAALDRGGRMWAAPKPPIGGRPLFAVGPDLNLGKLAGGARAARMGRCSAFI